MDEPTDAERVISSFRTAMDQMNDGEIVIHAVWADTPDSACVLYERTPAEDGVIGRRIGFPPHVVQDDPVSTAEALAQNIVEPLGSAHVSRDGTGILWVGLGGAEAPDFPQIWTGEVTQPDPVRFLVYREVRHMYNDVPSRILLPGRTACLGWERMCLAAISGGALCHP